MTDPVVTNEAPVVPAAGQAPKFPNDLIHIKFEDGKEFKHHNYHVDPFPLPAQTYPAKSYLSYYENHHGEQWVFIGVYGDNNKTAYLTGGDVGWERRKVPPTGFHGWSLNLEEKLWLSSCLMAFYGVKP